MSIIITIDGPAASGKSTVSRELASRLGASWVSTGAFYRGLAYAALQSQIPLDDRKSVVKLARSTHWNVKMSSEKTQVFFQGNEVTEQIAQEDVGNFASRISHDPEVREALLDLQRNCALGVSILIAEGRDCGTVVFPQAQLKIYLTATSDHRAARRAAEQGGNPEEILAAQKQRDHQDSTRNTAPLQVPLGAFVIDTTSLSLREVVDLLEKKARSLFPK